jgi:ABC-type transport system substrate-binding protein
MVPGTRGRWRSATSRRRPFVIAAIAASLVGAFLLPAAALAEQPKVDLCHATGNGSYVLINVSERAVATHIAEHGDVVPGTNGLNDDCVLVESGGIWEHLNFQFGPGRLIRNPDSLNEHLKFRQAIAHAIDKDRIAAEIPGADRPIDSYVEAFLPALSQGAWAQYDYDPAASMQLLAELCAELNRDCSSNPPRAVFTTTSESVPRVQLAGLLDEMLSDVGILFEIQLEEAEVFFGGGLINEDEGTIYVGTFDLGLWAWLGTPALDDLVAIHDVFDPEGLPLLGSDWNYYRWGTPDSSVIDANTARFAELRDLMNSTGDEAQIVNYIHEAEQILADQVVMIPLYIRVLETP